MQLGAIADDLTGATDLAIALTNAGFQTLVVPEKGLSTPAEPQELLHIDAVVVALKTRTSPVQDAVDRSLEALKWLQAAGCEQFYFKYCSTFDSTDQGNIGPVAEALMDALGASITVVAPAFPATGRTVYQGNLFVYDLPLHESSLSEHPLTPMRDSNIARLLAPQVGPHARIELLNLQTILRGEAAVKDHLEKLARAGVRYVVVDAITEAHLRTVAAACKDMQLLTGGSGLAAGLSGPHASGAAELEQHQGRMITLSGSASRTTQAQVQYAAERGRGIKIDVEGLRENMSQAVDKLIEAVLEVEQDVPTVVYATASPEDVVSTADAGLIEECLSSLAVELSRLDAVRGIIVAGGETSGAVIDALGVTDMTIGPQLAPGVAWVQARTSNAQEVSLVLKSGNFGSVDLFTEAWGVKG